MAASCLDLDQSVGTAVRRGAYRVGAARGLIGARPGDGPVTVSPASPTAEMEGRPKRQRPKRRCRMKELAGEQRGNASVFVGVDTHSEAHVAVALDGVGRRIGELRVPRGIGPTKTGRADGGAALRKFWDR